MKLQAFRQITIRARILMLLVALCYFLSHGVNATGIMPAPLSEGGFSLCHQNSDTRQLIALGANAEAHSHAQHHSTSVASEHSHHGLATTPPAEPLSKAHHISSLSAETGCDIGVWLDLGVLEADGGESFALTPTRPRVVVDLNSTYLPSLTRSCVRPRAPPLNNLAQM